MDKKEKIKKFDENLVVTFAAIGMITFFIVSLFAIFRITFLAPLLLLITPFISVLVLIKGLNLYSPKDAVHLILAMGVVCIFGLIAISENNGKHEAYLNKWLLGGSVEKERKFIEGDGETIDHYETFYVYESKNNDDDGDSKFIHYALIIISWGALIAHWFLFIAASKKYDTKV